MADETPTPAPVASVPSTPTASPSSPPTTNEAPASAAEETPSLLNSEVPGLKEDTGAPEKYDFTFPDGYKSDPEVMKEISGLFKGMNLTQGNAQKLVDFYVGKTKEAFDAPYNAYRDMTEGWLKEIKADPEIGGRLDQVKSTVASAIDSLGDPKLASDFRRAMDLTGAGNNPAFVRTFYKLAQMVTEGKAVAGRGPSPHGQNEPGTGVKPSPARALYPNLS